MTDPAAPAPPPAAPVSAVAREARRHRILERLLRGSTYDSIAEAEKLTRQRVGQIVRQTLARRGVDPAGGRALRRIVRLDASVRRAAQEIDDGDRAAIDRLLRALDRRQASAAAPAPRDGQDDAGRRAARRGRRVKRGAGWRARDAAARAADPARVSFGLQPSDFALSAEKKTSRNFYKERIARPRPAARRPVARATGREREVGGR
jgi:hypothetical protein